MYCKIKLVRIFFVLFPSLLMLVHDSFAVNDKTYTIAVLDLEANGVSDVEAKGLSEKIRTRISWLINNTTYKNNPGTDKYSVVERSQMDKILDQFNIQNTVCTDISCAIEFGKMLQADRIIIGSVNLIGKTYNITTRMVDIESAKSLSVSEVDYRGSIDGLLGSRIQDVADELLLGCSFNDWAWPKTRERTFVKSLYFPGSGQRYAEHKGKGYLITLAQAAAIAGVVETTLLSMEAQQDYDDAKDAYNNSASPDEFDRTYKILEEKYDTSKQAQTYQLISAGAALTVYIYNLIDAALTEPNIDKGFGEKRLFMEPRMTYGYSSITVSLRF